MDGRSESPRVEHGAEPPARGPGRALGWLFAAVLLLWLALALPLALGERTFYLRDVFASHLPLKAFGAEELRAGRIPAFNPTWAAGQPFRGNPNTLAFYPGNVLYLLLPFWSAFNLHYLLHWLLAMLTLVALARELGLGRPAALAAGLTYAGSGWVMSALSFYNILAVSAWWPLVLLGAVRGGRRGVALGGVACGLALLGGEPVTATLALVPLLWLAVERHGLRRGLLTAIAIGALGLAIALPQLVATLRVVGFTHRGQGLDPPAAGFYALSAGRLLELVVPFPWGWPGEIGPLRPFPSRLSSSPSYVMTLHFGALGLLLAAAGAVRRRGWAVLALLGLLLAWLGGGLESALAWLSAGLFRYPEKLLWWPALMLPLLVGRGFEEVLAKPRRWGRAALLGGLAAAAVTLLAALSRDRLAAFLVAEGGRPIADRLGGVHVVLWLFPLAALAALWLLAVPLIRRRSAVGLLLLMLLGLFQLHPLFVTDEVAPYAEPSPWAERLGRGTAVVSSTHYSPFRHPPPRYRVPGTRLSGLARVGAETLEPAPGVLHGLRYPLAADLEGMCSPPFKLLLESLPKVGWPERLRWMRALGVEAAVMIEDPGLAGLRTLERRERYGAETWLFAIEAAAPPVRWPRRVLRVAGSDEAFAAVANLSDPLATAVVVEGLESHGRGEARLLEQVGDALTFEAEGDGGLVVTTRAYQPLLRARSGGERLRTLAVDVGLLGVEVPPGRHRVEVTVSAWPEIAAGLLGLSALVAALVLAFGKRQ